MGSSLFENLPDGAHPRYAALFAPTNRVSAEARALCDGHWQHFRRLADRDFRARFPFEFQHRWFEMYLGVSLLGMGLDVSAPKPGPDLRVRHGDLTIWFEAIVPTAGDRLHADAVPEPYVARPDTVPVAQSVPVNQVALRVAQAVRQKINRFDRYRLDKRVGTTDACVIAINVRAIPHAWMDLTDYLLRTLYGIGDRYVVFRRDARDDGPAEWSRHAIEELVRAGGHAEDAIPLVRPENSALSAVLGSSVDAWNLADRLGDDFRLCPHVEPAVPLPAAMLRRGIEFVCRPDGDDGYTLQSIEHFNAQPERVAPR